MRNSKYFIIAFSYCSKRCVFSLMQRNEISHQWWLVRLHHIKMIISFYLECLDKRSIRCAQNLHNQNRVEKENFKLFESKFKSNFNMLLCLKTENTKTKGYVRNAYTHMHHTMLVCLAHCFMQSISLLLFKQKYFHCCFCFCLVRNMRDAHIYALCRALGFYQVHFSLITFAVWSSFVVIKSNHIFDYNSI